MKDGPALDKIAEGSRKVRESTRFRYDIVGYLFLIDYFKGVQGTRSLIAVEECCTTAINYHEIIAGVKG